MAGSGKSEHFSIRLSVGLLRAVDEEREKYHEGQSRTDFIAEALTFYLRDLEDRRHRKHEYESVRTINGPDS